MFRRYVKGVAIAAALLVVIVVFGYGMACMAALTWEIMRA
jgi:hypothetical protein